ncbi:hypothetical protein [Luteimonas panaciterrae]|uniref:hypothetical protein n=1 Tax=Luteimonas panaciterrae TaxID=363885 RepID=UPI001CF9F7BD|nr:hypothetical protein [Luteimonas panaciterrae]
MKHSLIAIALCSLLLSVAACKREPAETPAAAAPDTATAAPTADAAAAVDAAHDTDVISEVDHATTPAGIDVKAFAGHFSGDDIALELKADGNFALSGGAVAAPIDGTWTAEDNGKRIRLDPNSKSEKDWLLAVNSNDELQALDDEGKVPKNAPAGSLKRVK